VQPSTPLGADQVNVSLLLLWKEWNRKDLRGLQKKPEDDVDDDLLRTRSIAICEAQETMKHRVTEKSNPSAFLV
jgi:hypothetical protein